MSDSTTKLDLLTTSQAQKETAANSLWDAMAPAAFLGKRDSTTTGLTWGYYGGSYNYNGVIQELANGTVALTGGTTNYIEFEKSTGTVSANTSAYTTGRTKMYTVVTSASGITSYEDDRIGGGGSVENLPFVLSCSDLTTQLATGTNVAYFRAPSAGAVAEVRASLLQASDAGSPTNRVAVDIMKNGVSILSTKLSIDPGEKTSETAAVPAVIGTSAYADDDILSIDILEIGPNAKGLNVTLIVNPA